MGGITHETAASSMSTSSWYQPHLGYEFVRLAADRSNNTTSLADATGLTFSLLANNFYNFEFFVMFQTTATTTGIQLSLNAPANNYIVYDVYTPISTTAGTDSNRRAVGQGAATTGIDTANANTLATITGTVNPTSNGALVVRYASEVATSNAIVKAGSNGVLRQVT